MKRCPTCSRTYEDDSLSFCLTDGTPLAKEESVSGSFDSAPVPAPPVADWSAPPATATPSSQPLWGSVGLPPQQPEPAWGGGYQQMQSPPVFMQKREQGLAIASLVCGILSIACCGSVLTGIPAIVLGIISMNKEKNEPARYGGKGMAIGGIVLGSLSVLILFAYMIMAIAGAIPAR
jgi:hypothetical protein